MSFYFRLIEALVGELTEIDELEKPADIEQLDKQTWRVQGCADQEDAAEKLDVKLPTEECDTMVDYTIF